jgi:hypothetical protein
MKKVCLLGTSPTLPQAPMDDDTIEKWALNNMYHICPVEKISRWFQIHNEESVRDAPDWDKYKNITVPIYMQDHYPEIPTSVKFPLDEMVKLFGYKLFRSTLDFMMTMAIAEAYDVIYIYGVDMANNTEYAYQRPSLLFWIGQALGRGIKIIMPDDCDLLKNYFVYGYDDERKSDFEIKARARKATLEAQGRQGEKDYYLCKGAIDTFDFLLRDIGVTP